MRPKLLTAAAALLALTACAGDDSSNGGNGEADQEAQLEERLATAAELLNTTAGVRFTLDGENLPDTGNVILGAEGVAAPPASFEGDVRVIASGFTTTIEVISLDGVLWAKLPLTNQFAQVDAAVLGFGDPGALIDPERGVSQLLTSSTDLADAGEIRIGAETFDQVTATVPAVLVGELFSIADADADVAVIWSLDADTGHVRQAVLTGPFYDTGDEQSYTVALDDYDEPVEISAPAE